jgi:tetratricopeptide (TPR) repeat protein
MMTLSSKSTRQGLTIPGWLFLLAAVAFFAVSNPSVTWAQKAETDASATSISTSEAELDARAADLFAKAKQIIHTMRDIAVSEAASDPEWNHIVEQIAIAEPDMNESNDVFAFIRDKITPPDDTKDKKWFDFWSNRPSVFALFNKMFNRLEKPMDEMIGAANDLQSLFAETQARQQQIADDPACNEQLDPTFPSAPYDCRRCSRWTIRQQRILNNVFVIIEQINAELEDVFGQDAVAVGGGNLSAFGAIPERIALVTRLIKANVDICEADINGAEIRGSYDRLEYVHFELDTVQTNVKTVEEKLDGHIRAFNEWTRFSLRTRIEINLAGHGDHPHPIALFQLPEQYGGYLELARDIVSETIETMKSAGEKIYDAEKEFMHGEVQFDANHYKEAYEYYAKAYRAATRGKTGHK